MDQTRKIRSGFNPYRNKLNPESRLNFINSDVSRSGSEFGWICKSGTWTHTSLFQYKLKKKSAIIHRHCQTFPISPFSSSNHRQAKPFSLYSTLLFIKSSSPLAIASLLCCVHVHHHQEAKKIDEERIKNQKKRKKKRKLEVVAARKEEESKSGDENNGLNIVHDFEYQISFLPFSVFPDLTPQSPICHHHHQICHHYVWKLNFVCSVTFEFIFNYLILNYFPLLLVID